MMRHMRQEQTTLFTLSPQILKTFHPCHAEWGIYGYGDYGPGNGETMGDLWVRRCPPPPTPSTPTPYTKLVVYGFEERPRSNMHDETTPKP